jgi:hypothetical protein
MTRARRSPLPLLLLAGAATAQCPVTALPGEALAGPASGKIHAAIPWDPDGAGPLAERLVVGGDFVLPGAQLSKIAWIDLATGEWHAFGSGVGNTVRGLAALPNGDLVAVGDLTSAGGTPVFGAARWDGQQWGPMGNGLPGGGNVALLRQNGDLVVGCWAAAGLPQLVRWDGAAWIELGPRLDGRVDALAEAPNGDLYAGGNFVFGGSQFLLHVGRFDGTAWHHLAFGIGGGVSSLGVRSNGDLVVGGQFLSVGFPAVAALRVATWNGAFWAPMGNGSDEPVRAQLLLPNGDLVVSGWFGQLAVDPPRVGRWDGVAWSGVGTGPWNPPLALCRLTGGDLIAVGDFTACEGRRVPPIVRFDGISWLPIGRAPDNRVLALAVDAAGDLHVGGTFRCANGASLLGLARVHDGLWSSPPSVGSPFSYYADADRLVTLADGSLAATGFGGLDQRSIGIWDGQAWNVPQSTFDWSVHAIAQLPDGSLVVGGEFTRVTGGPSAFRTAKLVNGTFQPLSAQYVSNAVRSLLTLPDGSIVAGGEFTTVDSTFVGHVMRFVGGSWQPLGQGLGNGYYDSVRALAQLPDGSIVAGGRFQIPGVGGASALARWDGSTWAPLGGGVAGGLGPTTVHALLVLPDGQLVIGGDFTTAGGVPMQGLARWNGAGFAPVGPGVDGVVFALALAPDGDLLVGGDFQRSGASIAGHLLRLHSGCAPVAAVTGAGCTLGTRPLELVARQLPWLGGSYVATCDGVPQDTLGFAVRGFQSPALPLSVFTPTAGPGCLQLASMDAVCWLFPAGSRVTSRCDIPADPGLLGVQWFDQVLLAGLSPTVELTSLTSTNALRLVAGSF